MSSPLRGYEYIFCALIGPLNDLAAQGWRVVPGIWTASRGALLERQLPAKD